VPPGFSSGVAEALRTVTRAADADLAPAAAAAVREAVVLAETSAASEIADDALVDLDDLSPAERRELKRDVVNAIAALGTLIAILSRDGRIELASTTLALVAILVSIYWRLTGKLDEVE
jgi:hypothetical protein